MSAPNGFTQNAIHGSELLARCIHLANAAGIVGKHAAESQFSTRKCDMNAPTSLQRGVSPKLSITFSRQGSGIRGVAARFQLIRLSARQFDLGMS
jgi:hypothetical protein